MSNEKVVLCLEDTESRIRWLREIAESYGARVHSTAKVKEFVAICETHANSDVRAIVLDHDLGGYLMPVSLQDPDGLDGLDATVLMPVINAPVLIWSTNDTEPEKMEQTLFRRGYGTVLRQRWIDSRNEIHATLRKWCSRA